MASSLRLAILSRHHADHVVRNLQHFILAHIEQSRIDAIGSRRNDRDLRPALTAICKKGPRVLKGIAFDGLGQDAPARERMAVASLDDADVALVDGRERLHGIGVLPCPESEVDSRSERIRLQAGLAVQRDNGAVGKSAVFAEQNPLLVDNANLIIRNNDRSKENA